MRLRMRVRSGPSRRLARGPVPGGALAAMGSRDEVPAAGCERGPVDLSVLSVRER